VFIFKPFGVHTVIRGDIVNSRIRNTNQQTYLLVLVISDFLVTAKFTKVLVTDNICFL